ncbi:MAG: hypothetical protein IJT29_01650 [Oscillospiraceae bacterium]|nr:hypothetical protein [Oscillospiraceae bacterium]
MITEKKQQSPARAACVFVLVIILFFFSSILVRTLTRQLLEKRLGIRNSFTDVVLHDVQDIYDEGDIARGLVSDSASDDEADNDSDSPADNSAEKKKSEIDWAALYPFPAEAEEAPDKAANSNSASAPKKIRLFVPYTKKVQKIEDSIETYVTDYLLWYKKATELAKKYESVIRWSYASYGEYNGVIKLPDGWLTSFVAKRDVHEAAENMASFASFCEQNGIGFLYLQAPYKISRTQDSHLSGVVDFSNENADDLIEQLRAQNIEVYDFRDQIESEGLDHHSLFYRTDHHWLPETGLWAARHILEYLREHYAFDLDPALLDQEKFTSVLYPSWFLGSKGKKVTLSVTEPDDFTLLYPDYDTDIHFSIPNLGVDLDGDFSVVYDMDRVETCDYYNKNPYCTYMYGDRPLSQFENRLASHDLHLLCIHDSFGDCVLPFLSLGVRRLDSLDVRHFTGSVQTFVEETKPDVVMVLYNPGSVYNPSVSELKSHKATFDFR